MEISLISVLKVLLNKIWILLIATVVGALILSAYTVFAVGKQYTTSAKLYVHVENRNSVSPGTIDASDINLAKTLVNTYIEILKSTTVLNPVIESLDEIYDGITPELIKSWFNGESLNGTETFQITITTDDPSLSYDVMTAILEVAPERIKSVIGASEVSIIEEPVYPESYSWPLARNTAIGAVVGLILSAAVCVLISFLDTFVYTREDLTESFKLPVVGAIPLMKDHEELQRIHGRRTLIQRLMGKNPTTDERSFKTEKNMIINSATPFSVTEAYRMARTNILYLPSSTSGCPKFAFTSSFAMEGKTISTINLAITMAQNGKKVLLIDADMRKPRIAKNLGIKAESGLSEFLAKLTGTVTVSRSSIDNFYVITSGKATLNSSELLASDRMKQLISQLENEFDYIFIDTPPMNLVTDASVIADLVDGYFVVAFSGFSDKNAVADALESLSQVHANVIGFILNGVDPKSSYGRYGKYGKYGNYRSYGSSGAYQTAEPYVEVLDKEDE